MSPNISPLRFLRIVASEYLAAYELTGDIPAVLKHGEQARETDEFLRKLEDAAGARPTAVVDISLHPKFDRSALTPDWDQSSRLRPSIGA